MRTLILAILATSALAGCATRLLETDGQVGADEVTRRIKDELSKYYVYMHQHEQDAPAGDACRGQITFTIKSVTVTMATQPDNAVDVTGSASVPVGAVGTIGPSLDVTRDAKSTTTMKYTFYPIDPGRTAQPMLSTAGRWEGFPIASSIEQLRESLIAASDAKPCVGFTSPDDPGPPVKKGAPADQTVTFDFNVVRTVKGGATFKFVLFSVGATGTAQRGAQNTVQVTFNATPKSVGLQ